MNLSQKVFSGIIGTVVRTFGNDRCFALEADFHQLVLFGQQRIAVHAVNQRVFRLERRTDGFHQFAVTSSAELTVPVVISSLNSVPKPSM